jgi:acyl-CoA thioesterase
MNLYDILNDAKKSDDNKVNIPDKWGQGRATFGGLVAGLLFEKILPHVQEGRPVKSIMVSFVAPVTPGESDVHVRVLRTGKAATQVQATMYQNDQACAVLIASFGGDRESIINIEAQAAPNFSAPQDTKEFPFIKGLTPDFSQYFDYRYTQGNMPFMGNGEHTLGGFIKLHEAAQGPIQVSELLSLLDAWPPTVFALLKRPTSGSTLTWNISFVHEPEDCTANDWWQYQADIKSSAHGYSHIDANMWDKNGRLTLMSRQTVSVFA